MLVAKLSNCLLYQYFLQQQDFQKNTTVQLNVIKESLLTLQRHFMTANLDETSATTITSMPKLTFHLQLQKIEISPFNLCKYRDQHADCKTIRPNNMRLLSNNQKNADRPKS